MWGKIVSVNVGANADGVEEMTLRNELGQEVKLTLHGDCCSGSFFEALSVADAKALVGQELRQIATLKSSSIEDHGEMDHLVCRYHAIKITTDQGVTVLDWRNESNGYYDGECVVSGFGDPRPVEVA